MTKSTANSGIINFVTHVEIIETNSGNMLKGWKKITSKRVVNYGPQRENDIRGQLKTQKHHS
jgi:hypothetical protein